jgi:hypothetical protein
MSIYAFYKRSNSVKFDIKELLPKQHIATEYITIDKSTIPLSAQGNEYSISFWMFIKDFNYRYGSNKTILYRGDKANTESNPYIYLNPKSNDMTIKVQLQSNSSESFSSSTQEGFTTLPFQYFNASNISGNEVMNGTMNETINESFDPTTSPTGSTPQPVGDVNSRLERIETQMQRLIGMQTERTTPPGDSNATNTSNGQSGSSGRENPMPVVYDQCVVENIPLQKWTHVVVSVLNNSVEVYLDGRLVKTCTLKGVAKPNIQNMHVCANGGFDGFIANLEYSNMTMSSNDIYYKYQMGPELNKGFLDSIGDFFSRFISVFTE